MLRAMMTIRLSSGMTTAVDDVDYEALAAFVWHSAWYGTTWYATRSSRHHTIYMHREIMGAPKGTLVDHVNRNGLDNRRGNLRACTKSQNAMNGGKMRRPGSSRFRGVALYKATGRWVAYIAAGPRMKDGRASKIHLGYFRFEEDAARAYDAAARIHFGEFAAPNFS